MSEGDYTESDDEGESAYKSGGYHPVSVGETYGDKYLVKAKLGWGHFSTVWLVEAALATNTTTVVSNVGRYYALKIQKSAPHYMEAAQDEVEMLTLVKERSSDDGWRSSVMELVKKGLLPEAVASEGGYTGVVRLEESMLVNGPNGVHMGFVFEAMGPNILALIKKYNFQGVPLDLVKKIATHLLVGLDYLHRVCGLIHTDLKPENALVGLRGGVPVDKVGSPLVVVGGSSSNGNSVVAPVVGEETDIFNDPSVIYKIVDLGNSCYVDRHFSEDIQTRQYRAPEVLLHADYDTKADMWSLACMVFELVTGDYLFDPKGTEEFPRDEDHLALMIELLGPIPKGMVDRSRSKAKYYNRKYQLRHIKDLKRWALKDVLAEKYGLEKNMAKELSEFLLPMLVIEPVKRASAEDMLRHPWLQTKGSFEEATAGDKNGGKSGGTSTQSSLLAEENRTKTKTKNKTK